MLHKELTGKAQDTLSLEQCPEPVQVMPPAPEVPVWSLLAMVCGNVLVGTILIGGLMLAPYVLAALIN